MIPTVSVLGLVTIGQAPRTDLVPELRAELAGVSTVEAGALDGLGGAELAAVAPQPGDTVFVSRLRDGSSVRIGGSHLVPLIEAAVARAAARGAESALLLCTGEFPGEFRAPIPVLHAESLAATALVRQVGAQRLGVVSPLPEQKELVAATWLRRLGRSVLVESADPYAEDASPGVAAACERLAGAGAELVFLDCIGYTKESAATAAARAGVPVLAGRALAVREAVRQGQGRSLHGSMP